MPFDRTVGMKKNALDRTCSRRPAPRLACLSPSLWAVLIVCGCSDEGPTSIGTELPGSTAFQPSTPLPSGAQVPSQPSGGVNQPTPSGADTPALGSTGEADTVTPPMPAVATAEPVEPIAPAVTVEQAEVTDAMDNQPALEPPGMDQGSMTMIPEMSEDDTAGAVPGEPDGDMPPADDGSDEEMVEPGQDDPIPDDGTVIDDESDADEELPGDDEASDDGASSVESEFDIELVFQVEEELDPIVEEAFEGAKARWEQAIVGDLEDVESPFPRQCDGFEVPRMVDDLVIGVSLRQIDGPNGILGAAGPCAVRGDGAPLPFAGVMQFDTADLLRFGEQGRLEEIVLHEMGHVLGIGSLWQPLGLLDSPAGGGGGTDTAFTGPLAIAEFDALGGMDYEGAKVPVQNSGGQGVANGHWRESVFGNELMTPFLSPVPGLMSDITIASLEDLGYEVSYAAADSFSYPPEQGSFGGGIGAASLASTNFEVWLEDDILDIPIYAMDRTGKVWRIR